MSANPQPQRRQEPKPQERDTVRRDVKREIENLRRLIETVRDRLHELAKVV